MFDGYLFSIERLTLTVRYRSSGEVYTYQGIDPELYEEFAEAESQGKFFNANIAGKFKAIKEEAADAAKVYAAAPVEDSRPRIHLSEVGHMTAEAIQSTPDAVIPNDVIASVVSARQTPRHICKECGVNLDDDKDCYVCGSPQEQKYEPVAYGISSKNPVPHVLDEEEKTFPSLNAGPSEEQLARDIHEHGKSEAMTAPPRVISEPDVPTTPAEAIAILTEESGYVGATIAQAKEASSYALTVKVGDLNTYSGAGDLVVKLTGMKDRAVKFLDPIRKVLYEPYKLAQEKLKEASDPLDVALNHLKKQRVAFQQEQDRLAEVERQRLQKIADDEARQRQQEASQQLTMAEVQDRLDQGDEQGAAELLEKPIQAAPVYVPPVRVEAPIVKTEGVSTRANWKAEIPGYPEDTTEFAKLVLSVAEGICDLAAHGNLKGHAPISVLMPNMTTLNQKAKAEKKSFSLPGVRAWNDASEVARRGRH
jgi:hypothetical protein